MVGVACVVDVGVVATRVGVGLAASAVVVEGREQREAQGLQVL